jgi:hypothetical protein
MYKTYTVRLQQEAPDRNREFNFIDESGPYTAIATKEMRTVKVASPAGLFELVASRTRLVMNEPIENLVLQIVDTILHHALLSHELHSLVVQSPTPLGVPNGYMFEGLDFSHYERVMGEIAHLRPRYIGGRYEEIATELAQTPYICPGTDGNLYLVSDDREAGFTFQFGSGSSQVSPMGKDVYNVAAIDYFINSRGLLFDSAMTLVLNGGDSDLRMFNYGDDNAYIHKGELENFQRHLATVFDVSYEGPVYLGARYRPETDRLHFRTERYVEQRVLGERGPFTKFKPYPWHGWVEAREAYRTYGEPDFIDVMHEEDIALQEHTGLTWPDVVAKAAEDKLRMEIDHAEMHQLEFVDKEHLMSGDEKLRSSSYIGYNATETFDLFKQLIGREQNQLIQY